MEVFGIGPLEFLFIFIIILLVLGPKDIEKTARNLGKGLNRIYRSPNYQVIRKASEEIRNLPARLAAEAQLDELKEMTDFKEIEKDLTEAVKTINTAAADPLKAWVEETKKVEGEIKAEVRADIKAAGNGTALAEVKAASNGTAPAVENSIAPPLVAPAPVSPPSVLPPPVLPPAVAPPPVAPPPVAPPPAVTATTTPVATTTTTTLQPADPPTPVPPAPNRLA